MRRWSTFSFSQKSEVIGAAMGACFATMYGLGDGLLADAIAVLIGAVIGWGIGRLVAAVWGRK
jgi:hypothetical protein